MLMRILLAGDGGQGIQTLSDIICRVCFVRGWHVSHIPNYGLEQRGGVSLAYIQISDREIVHPKFSTADFLLIMSEQAGDRVSEYKRAGCKIINYKTYEKLFEKENISSSSRNVFFLGVITKILEEKKLVTKAEVFGVLKEKLGKKSNWEESMRVFEKGRG